MENFLKAEEVWRGSSHWKSELETRARLESPEFADLERRALQIEHLGDGCFGSEISDPSLLIWDFRSDASEPALPIKNF